MGSQSTRGRPAHSAVRVGAENAFWVQFVHKTRLFYRDRLGTYIGKVGGKGRFVQGNDHGDTCGTSYSSMKRMLYTLLMYDAATTGFEVYYYYPPPNQTKLSPIGRMQARAKSWAEANPPATRGVHVATTGFLLDFLSGWETPCSVSRLTPVQHCLVCHSAFLLQLPRPPRTQPHPHSSHPSCRRG